jgi:hypothetical protein
MEMTSFLIVNGLLKQMGNHDALLDAVRDLPITSDVMIVDSLTRVTAFGKRVK